MQMILLPYVLGQPYWMCLNLLNPYELFIFLVMSNIANVLTNHFIFFWIEYWNKSSIDSIDRPFISGIQM
ncbi:hypothetical protein BM1_02104 [Bipolaris maydis]|nr:hypothetical protein BM1_02104 [Bipolaris maydis]